MNEKQIQEVISGALFDFAGYLTTLDEPVTFGSHEEASPMVKHIQAWAGKRGLSLDGADVQGWSSKLAAPQPAQAEPAKPDPARKQMEDAAGYWTALTHVISTRGARLEVVEHRGRRGWDCTVGGTTARGRATPEAALYSAIQLEFDGDVPESLRLPKSDWSGKLVPSDQALVAQAEQPKAQQEPVAKVRVHKTGGNAGISWSAVSVSEYDSLPPLPDGTPLYTSAPQREPMTEAQIRLAVNCYGIRNENTAFSDGVRYAESFHNITKDTK